MLVVNGTLLVLSRSLVVADVAAELLLKGNFLGIVVLELPEAIDSLLVVDRSKWVVNSLVLVVNGLLKAVNVFLVVAGSKLLVVVDGELLGVVGEVRMLLVAGGALLVIAGSWKLVDELMLIADGFPIVAVGS